jgi:Sulfotransferase family
MALPDFLIVGAPKAGTTALHVALARHPQLYLSRVKEPKHFLTDGPPRAQGGPGDAKTLRAQVWQREAYEALFADAPPSTLLGESTSLYLRDGDALARIRATIPDVRIIALLRDPVDRAHSNWAHLWSAGLEPEHDFVTACRLEEKRTAAGWAPFWRYLSLGRYGEQLALLWDLFPREQTLVLRYRELRESPAETLDRIAAFLGVQTGLVTETTAENVTTHATISPVNRAVGRALRIGSSLEGALPHPLDKSVGPGNRLLSRHLQREQRVREPLTLDQREALLPHFTDDVALLEQLTGESFADWLDLDVDRFGGRAQLRPAGRIGTAHQSIDRPIRD